MKFLPHTSLRCTAFFLFITSAAFSQSEEQNPATLPTGAGIYWKTLGNANTVDGTHFVGTIDNVPLNFRVSNIPAGRIESGGTQNTFLGFESGLNNTSLFNTFTGYRSGWNNNTGRNNTGIGNYALRSNGSGSYLVAVGDSALYSNNSGTHNVAVGSRAATLNSSNSFITAVGDSALYSNIQNNNTAVGASALAYNTTAFANTAMGMHALRKSNGNYNTGLGSLALSQNTSGASNTATGANAMISNTTGSNNTSAGTSALYSNTGGSFNSAYGTDALRSNVVGSNNTAIGKSALFQNQSSQNTAVGVDALSSNNTGMNNVAVGYRSMNNGYTAGYSVAIGADAMYLSGVTASAAYNVAVGAGALTGGGAPSSNTGVQNTAIGGLALSGNTSGAQNTAVGVLALSGNNVGGQNVALGYNALASNTDGTENTAVGYVAGFSVGSGDFNTLIGSRTAMSFPFLTNASAIGYRAYVVNSNSMVLGSISGINGATATVNVGIGTPQPTHRLHLVGSIRIEDGFQSNNRVLVSDFNGVGRWQTLTTAQTNAWGLTGNSGTTDGVNYLGTNDGVPLTFRVSGGLAGRIEHVFQNTFLGHTAGTNNTGVGNSFFGADAGFANTNGGNNTFMGNVSGNSNTIGSFNTFYGSSSGSNNTTAGYNTFIGRLSGYSNTTGSENVAVGEAALANNSTGFNNTAVGRTSGSAVTTGSENTLIGYNAEVSVGGLVNATAIGANAAVGASNSMVLGSIAGTNGALSSINVGIGVTAPQTRLHVVGGTDAELTIPASGYLMLGDVAGLNILADNNEIMARNNGTSSPIYFQVDGGRVGIGNTGAPAYQLELSTNSAGKPTSTVWTVSSDLRLKKDIRPYEGGLKEILQINPVWYRYNGLAGLPIDELGVGTIAQELEKVAPYMIKPYIKEDAGGNKTEYKSVDYNAMLFMFVNAFKEQQQKIDALQQQLDLLKKN